MSRHDITSHVRDTHAGDLSITITESSHAARHPDSRTLLMIASRYPPASGPGPMRIAKMVRYLSDFGWNCVVITRRHQDESRSVVRLPPQTRVLRIDASNDDDWLSRMTSLVSGPLDWMARFGLGGGTLSEGLRWRRDALRDRLSLPDPGIWRCQAVLRAVEDLHSQKRFDAIFSSGMPFSDHLIARAVRSELGLPWIAEFRDPWVEYAHAPQWNSTWGQLAVSWMEQSVIEQADHVVSVSDQMSARFRERYPRETPHKFVTIANGFDPEDFRDTRVALAPALERLLRKNVFTLLHAGSFYGDRSPERLIRAFAALMARHPNRVSHSRLIFAGRLGPYTAMVERAAETLPIEITGMLPHNAALNCMRRVSANVLIMADGVGTSGDVSAKVFEYLGARRALLAIVPPQAAAAELLNRHDGVWQAAPNSDAAIEAALESMYASWISGGLEEPRKESDLTGLTRRDQAQRMAALFDHLTRRTPSGVAARMKTTNPIG